MNTKTDEGLYEKARKLFISKASIDEFAGWATPRQVDAVHRLLDTELANRERAKHDRLLRRARFPVVKGLDGYDFTNDRLRQLANPACGRSSALFLVLFMYACHSIYCLQLVHLLSATAGSKIPPPSWWSEAFWGSQNITSLPLRTR